MKKFENEKWPKAGYLPLCFGFGVFPVTYYLYGIYIFSSLARRVFIFIYLSGFQHPFVLSSFSRSFASCVCLILPRLGLRPRKTNELQTKASFRRSMVHHRRVRCARTDRPVPTVLSRRHFDKSTSLTNLPSALFSLA